MCSGGRMLADFVAGGHHRPDVPDLVGESLTTTIDGAWVVWANKLARTDGDRFAPLSGHGSYGADAEAECMLTDRRRLIDRRRNHRAPDPSCTCGFHAVSNRALPGLPAPHHGLVRLQVVLSGRVLAFEWEPGGVLLRAERQTVVRSGDHASLSDEILADLEARFYRPPADPDGRTARLPAVAPFGSGPVRLSLPTKGQKVAVADDAGWCHLSAVEARDALALPCPSALV